jgi:hypothetical protein
MQIGCMRLARIERDDHALALKIDIHVLHAVNLHQWSAQFAYAFVAVLAFGCDLDRFQNRMIGVFGIVRIARIRVVWSGWVHASPLSYVRQCVYGRLISWMLRVER